MARSRWLRSATAALLVVVAAAIVSTPAVSLWATESPELATLSAPADGEAFAAATDAPRSSDLTVAHNDQSGRGPHLVWWFVLLAAIAVMPAVAARGWWSSLLPDIATRRVVFSREPHGQRAPPLLL